MAAALASTTSAPQPHEVFPASSVIELCGAAVLRTAEDLNSENCGELEQGQACFVLGHGTSPDSRRLQVYVVGKGLRGWISCVAKSGRKLVTMIGAPGSDVAAGAAGEFQAIAGAAVAGAYAGSPRSGSIFSAAPAIPMVTQHSQSSACTPCQSVSPAMPMPAMPACGTMQSNHSACAGQAIQSQGAMPAMPGVGTMQSQSAMPAMPGVGPMQSQSAMQAWSPAAVQSQASSYSAGGCQVDMAPRSCGFSAASDVSEAQGRGNVVPPASAPAYSRGSSAVNSSAGAGQFPPGCRVAVLDEMVMRAEESLKSEQLAVLEEGTLLDVVGSGSEPGTRRLYVRHQQSGTLGWISFVAQSGRPLVALAAAEVAPPAFAAMPSTRSRSTSAAGIGTTSASIFSAQEAPVEHGVSIPMPATGVASVASVASRVSRVSYHPQVITQEVEPAGKQWLRRQKAQDLREEAPKRFLVDNRLLHAGTEGVNYRFSKDLEDIDLSCTALWGSVIEGVDEGDGWLCVSGELYLPMQLAGVPILTIEESPWALAGLQVVEAFPTGSAVLMLEAAIMRAAEDLRSTAICQLEKEQRMQILGHGAGARNRRLFVQDPVSGQDGWISFVSQTGKLLVTPLDHSPEQMQKVATMITTRQQLESFDGQGASVSMEVAQAQEEPAAPEPQQAFLVDNRAFKADSDGVGYRASPDLEDKVVPARTALWGTVVHGVADDEGWLRVGAYYLPMTLKGIRVLTPEAEAPKAHLPQLPGFARGDWEYICIDPKGASTYFQPGAPTESGQAVQPGELVRICERGLLGQKLWLCLMDGRGWVLEKSERMANAKGPPVTVRQLSEVSDEGKVAKGTKMMLDPRLQNPVKILPAPFAFGAVTGAPELLAGTVVEVIRKVQVLVPSPFGENWARYYKVEDQRRIEGWLGELRVHCGIKDPSAGETVLCDFQAGGFAEPKFHGKPCWVSVVSKNPVPLLSAPSRRRATKKTLSPGDFVEAVEELRTVGLAFYRLIDGCWVSRDDSAGKVACDLVVRERHKWIYVCNDKDGAQVRTTPTRSQARNANKKLKYRARVIVSEKVTLSDGDVFLKLGEDKKGWVPATKLNSSVVKMAPLQALEEGAAARGPAASRPPASRPPPACNGYGAAPPMPQPVNSYSPCPGAPGPGAYTQTYVGYSYGGQMNPADFGMGGFGHSAGGDFGLGGMPAPMAGPGGPGPMPGPAPVPSGSDFGLAAASGYAQMPGPAAGNGMWGAPQQTMAPPTQVGAWGAGPGCGCGGCGYGYGMQ